MDADKHSEYCDEISARTPTVSVVVPVFNGASFVSDLLKSIQKQSFKNFEVICIDDCSEDDSFEIIQKTAKLDTRIRALQTPCNQGSAGRCIDLFKDHISGEYFVYASQDDFFSTDWLEAMVSRARETGADAVVSSVVFFHCGREDNLKLSGVFGDTEKVISGREAFKLSLDWSIPGNALWKSLLMKRFGIFTFSAFADEYTVRLYFIHCKAVAFSTGVFYYRQDNPDAITKRASPKLLDLSDCDVKLWSLIREHGLSDEVGGDFAINSVRRLLMLRALCYANKELSQSADILLQRLDFWSHSGARLLIWKSKIDRRFLHRLKVFLSLNSHSWFHLSARLYYGRQLAWKRIRRLRGQ